MLKELNDIYQKMMGQWAKQAQPMLFDFLKSDTFLSWLKYFHIWYFDEKEKVDKTFESFLENARIASKNDVEDLVDAQRLTIDMLEDLTEKVDNLYELLEKKAKGAVR